MQNLNSFSMKSILLLTLFFSSLTYSCSGDFFERLPKIDPSCQEIRYDAHGCPYVAMKQDLPEKPAEVVAQYQPGTLIVTIEDKPASLEEFRQANSLPTSPKHYVTVLGSMHFVKFIDPQTGNVMTSKKEDYGLRCLEQEAKTSATVEEEYYKRLYEHYLGSKK